uniref:endoplasmic reticulum metallopeptidase 1 isoform X1 n=1 Tax=Erigeron canadensis TaxID=72917 RepID=UPI001CB94A78|nr:endoplasmic reticulum metallopeptidase 1 isoform X1 [Erigeron canadensis]
MRNRSKKIPGVDKEIGDETKVKNVVTAKRSGYAILAMFIFIIQGIWAVHHYQFESLPEPLSAEQVGKRGFSEVQAMKHVVELTQLGPHPVGSDALELGLQYVLEVAEEIKKTAHWEVDVEVDLFHASSGANILVSGLFKGKTLVYSDLKHVVLKISPKYNSEAEDSAILVSSHIDTVFSAEGAGDCSSCVAVMLELARGISHWAHGFKNSVIFLFNTGEEEGLNGAHSFITQHPWSSTIRMAIDLEAMGIGGPSAIFQAGPHPWAIENFALVAKYPSGQILAQDLFTSGLVKSATDFQVYREVAGLSGLDFAYADNTAVYHTKNDKLKLLKPGSLQHLGENMLAFLLHTAASSQLSNGKAMAVNEKSDGDAAIYFDILGTYMVVFRQRFANMLYNSVIMQSIMIWATSVVMGGSPATSSLALSVLGILLMWIFSLSFSIGVAFILPLVSSSPVPFISNPWLVGGLFASPAFLGALTGQHISYLILKRYISRVFSKRMETLSPVVKANWAKLEAERSLYKSGLLQWLFLLIVGNYFKVGSSYIALVWLISPAFAYGLLEATLSSARAPKALKTITLLLGLFIPFLISGGMFIRLAGTVVGMAVRFDRNPGGTPEWLGSLIVAVYISAVICLTMVYLLSYIHISGAKKLIAMASLIVFGLSLSVVISGIIPPFTEDISRAVNIVHVVDASGRNGEYKEPSSYISFFSTTPGKLTKEIQHIGEGFECGRENVADFVTFTTTYSCWTKDDSVIGWSKSDIPTLNVERDLRTGERVTQVTLDTKASTRWSLAINTNKIEDFRLKDVENGEELIQIGAKSASDGWHIIQFSGGKNAPKRFDLTLYWDNNQTQVTIVDGEILLKLRTDVDQLTPKVKRILEKLPSWCSLFGKSTSPHTLAFLNNLRVPF